MPLDPQFRAILDTLETKGLLPLVREDAAASRAHYRQLALSRRGRAPRECLLSSRRYAAELAVDT